MSIDAPTAYISINQTSLTWVERVHSEIPDRPRDAFTIPRIKAMQRQIVEEMQRSGEISRDQSEALFALSIFLEQAEGK